MIKKINLFLIITLFFTLSSQDFKTEKMKILHQNIFYSGEEFHDAYIKIKALKNQEKLEIASICFNRNIPHLLKLDVDESFRNNGIALSLLYYMFHFYKKNHPNETYVEFLALSKARTLYLKYGAEAKEKIIEQDSTFMKWNINTALEKIGGYLDGLHK
jgi:hypothetical protein